MLVQPTISKVALLASFDIFGSPVNVLQSQSVEYLDPLEVVVSCGQLEYDLENDRP